MFPGYLKQKFAYSPIADLNTDSNEEARLITGGSGFQFNYFPGSAFVDISAPAMMHMDIYCDNIADGDALRIRLLGSDTSVANIARVTLNSAQSGTPEPIA